jgi:hypothetical protein
VGVWRRVKSAGCRAQGIRCRVYDIECRAWGVGCRAQVHKEEGGRAGDMKAGTCRPLMATRDAVRSVGRGLSMEISTPPK